MLIEEEHIMAKVIVILLLAGAAWFIYSNWSDLSSTLVNAAKNEKTVQVVGGTRGELNSEAQAAMENE